MILQPKSLEPDGNPDEASVAAMKAALRDLKVIYRKPKEHPRREELLGILGDAKAAIERINTKA